MCICNTVSIISGLVVSYGILMHDIVVYYSDLLAPMITPAMPAITTMVHSATDVGIAIMRASTT